MSSHIIIAAQGAALVALAIYAMRKHIVVLFNKILSTVFNVYLSRRHAIRHIDDGSKFPSNDYVWPNGQG